MSRTVEHIETDPAAVTRPAREVIVVRVPREEVTEDRLRKWNGFWENFFLNRKERS